MRGRRLRLYVCAGEASGDALAAAVVRRLRDDVDLQARGLAGPAMRAAGVQPAVRAEAATALGLVEVVRHLPRIARVLSRLATNPQQVRACVRTPNEPAVWPNIWASLVPPWPARVSVERGGAAAPGLQPPR